jgi:hypothetical protein
MPQFLHHQQQLSNFHDNYSIFCYIFSPMNAPLLLRTFSHAISWNAFFYLIYKASFTLRTFLLYHTMSSTDFATWATLNSTLFLLLLWLDFGLRKSIPRYAPLFISLRHRLLRPILLLQFIILLGALPLFLYGAHCITHDYIIMILATSLYLTEGINTIMRSLYHAYFHNRFFNQVAAYCTISESIATIIAISIVPPCHVLGIIFGIQWCMTSILTSIALHQWSQQPVLINPPISTNPIPSRATVIQYTGVMWVTTILMSISERNFLLPFITYCTGITTGNLFKIANDGALFFYRFIIKTIGSADIALLAHAQEYATTDEQSLMRELLQKLSIQIMRLIVPLLGVLVSLVPIGWWFYHDRNVFHAFLIMTIGYLSETIWIPYERILEIKQHYKELFIIYTMYTIIISIIFFLFYTTWIGFFNFIIVIHGVRLVMGMLMRYSVYRQYHM